MRNRFNPKPAAAAAVAAALVALTGTANAADRPGYVSNSGNQIWTSPYGLCWKTTDWTPDKAVEPCDSVPRAQVQAPPPPIAATPAPPPPAPAPIAQAAPPPPAPVIERVSLESDVLFEFNKAELRPAGQQKLDELADRLKDAQVESVLAVGHADRIASEKYNQELSEKRAEAVKQYLAQKGIESQRVRAEGRGESQPVTGDQCKRMGAESAGNRKLVACLQPDRRVEVEVRGTREVAGTSTPSAGGTGGVGTSGSSGSSSGFGSTSGSSGGSSATPGSSGSSGQRSGDTQGSPKVPSPTPGSSSGSTK